jgi:hypothetical protein
MFIFNKKSNKNSTAKNCFKKLVFVLAAALSAQLSSAATAENFTRRAGADEKARVGPLDAFVECAEQIIRILVLKYGYEHS